MFFFPYPDERKIMEHIHHYYGGDYCIIRVTQTMVDKNNIDANDNFRRIVTDAGLVDYSYLAPGGSNGKIVNAIFIRQDDTETFRLKMYLVQNARRDRRFSIEQIRRKNLNHEIEVGDLLYFGYKTAPNNEGFFFMINLTHQTPSDCILQAVFGHDEIQAALDELMPSLCRVVHGGPYPNHKGPGKISPKDAGDTFEFEMGIQTNNDPGADYKGLIEFKTKRVKTLDTLFTLRPSFEGTPVAAFEPSDRNRVSAFARLYGYESDKHPGQRSLYITIANQDSPHNAQGFFLNVNYDAKRVDLMHQDAQDPSHIDVTAYWDFDALRQELHKKHPSTLWVTVNTVSEGTADSPALFSYPAVEFSRSPQFTTFLSLIERGIVSYDWRGYTTPSGPYRGKNHGNAWRINQKYKNELFDSLVPLNFI